MKKYLYGLAGFLLLLSVDQWTKWLVSLHLQGRGELRLVRNVFVLQYLENRGAAFGVLQNQRFFLIAITVGILFLLVFLYKRIPSSPKFHILRAMDVMLAAGAVGNLIDRLFRGYVIDFFYFKLIDFPVFNVADCYVVGAALISAVLIEFYYKEADWNSAKRD